MYWHALPDGWQDMEYRQFLTARRKLMALVVRDAFKRLDEREYSPVYPRGGVPSATERSRTWTSYGITVGDLIADELLDVGTTLIATAKGAEVLATVLPDGKIAYGDEVYQTPSAASDAAAGNSTNGWIFWAADTLDGRFTLSALRSILLDRRQ